MKSLIYVIVMLLIVVMLFIKPLRRAAARISASCDYPIQKFISLITPQLDKLQKRFPSVRLSVLWYYGIIDGIINLVILFICRHELIEVFTHWRGSPLIKRILMPLRELTPIGLLSDAAELLGASTYKYSSYHLLSAIIGVILTAIIIDISSYITTYSAEKREKARIVACQLPTKWDMISRFLFAVLYMISSTLLARKIPTLQFVIFIVLDASFLLKVILYLLILLLICAFFFRVFVPASIAIGIGTIWVFASIPFMDHFHAYFDISGRFLDLFTVIWFIGMLFWSTFRWRQNYITAQKAFIEGSVKSFGANEKLSVRIVLLLIRLYRFEIGDNLRDRFLKEEPTRKKKSVIKPDQGNNAHTK